MVDDRQVDVQEYAELAQHSAGLSYRQLGVLLGLSHEGARQRVRTQAAKLVREVEEHLDAGRHVLVEVPYQRQDEWQEAHQLFARLLKLLRADHVNVVAQTVPSAQGTVFELKLEEES